VDIDPQAIQATRDNAQQNQVHTQLRAIEHDAVFDPRPVDLVLGNILARPLIELAPLLIACLRPGARIVLAGLLDRQAEEVRQAYAAAVEFESDLSREGWTRLAGRRR
jgi:ribosomal protein L11 methyltransferase